MKRYEPETDSKGSWLGAMNRYENGDFVHFEDAQAEIDRLNKACDQRAAHEHKLMGEIDALKAQNAELLAALTESLAYVEATLSNHDAGCQRHPSTEHARDCILSDLDQIKTAIAKARGDL